MILTMAASMAADLSSSTLFVLFVSSREAIAMRTYIHTYINIQEYEISNDDVYGEHTTFMGLVNWSLKAKLSEFLIPFSYIHTYIHTYIHIQFMNPC